MDDGRQPQLLAGRRRPIDRVVFRIFTNPDAMVAALQEGEIDAAHLIPSASFEESQDDPDIEAVAGRQGGFTELAMNGMAGGIGDGHPALQDINVRHAIAHAIDRGRDVRSRRARARREGRRRCRCRPIRRGRPTSPRTSSTTTTPTKRHDCSTKAVTSTRMATASARCRVADRSSMFRYAERSESEQGPAIREFITGFLSEIGIGTEVSVFDDTQLTDVIASGEYDLFSWGWTPFVDPDPMLSYFTCDQVTTDIESVGYNDANWCDERVRRAVRAAEGRARPRRADRHRARDAAAVLRRVARTSCSTRTPTPRPTAPTGSRAGCSSPPRSGRCCSPTRRRRTST